jgi:dihydrolipoamide dehydrogenase
MADPIEIRVPDIGGYDDVPVIEVLVAVGDTVAIDQGLVTLESDKATMEVPASAAGTVREVKVKVGDTVSEGTVIAVLEAASDDGKQGEDADQAKPARAPDAPSPRPLPQAGEGASPPGSHLSRVRERACPGPDPGSRRAARRVRTRRRRRRGPPAPLPPNLAAARPTSSAACSCSAPAPAATPRHSAPPTSGSTRCWSSATRNWVGSASTSAASRPRHLLHAAAVIDEAAHARDYGVDFRRA